AGTPPESDPLFRTAVNLNKYVCSVDAGLVVHHAMEILGGNGTIEDFSPLPRLYRDVPVQETWEGPHNTLMAQMLRDAARAKMHDALLGYAQDVLLGAGPAAFSKTRDRALAALEETRGRLAGLLRGDLADAALHIRVLMTRVARITQVALLLEDAQYAADDPGWAWLEAAAELILNRWVVPGWEPMDDPGYPALVGRVLGE
ncbi:MAG TPA: acyl-CoA dehydrogenase family protein, partial [Methylomirabilota bacterium]|nr:acyl-CoA dehydrogenase family protein [Methylomirabilota bacterium]